MKASEALLKMNQAQVELDKFCIENILPLIFSKIEEAANKGEGYIYYSPCFPMVIKQLKLLGYSINNYQDLDYCISWQPWYKRYI